MKKHLLTLVAAVLCVLSASADFTVGDLTYTTVGSNAWCTGMSSSAISSGVSIVRIPAYVVYNGTSYPVTDITNTSSTSGPFAGNTRITEVYIGPNVKTIGYRAFYNCSALKTVYIYGDVGTIADVAFGNCTSLDNVYTAMTTASGNSSAFDGAKSGRAVHTLRGAGFSDLVAAFKASNCWKGFKSFSNNFSGGIYYNYNQGGNHYFRITSGPKSSSTRGTIELIDVDAGTTKVQPGWGLYNTYLQFGGADGTTGYYNFTSIHSQALRNNTTITEVDLSGASNITELPASAFDGCTNLATVTLPETLKKMGSNIFSGTAITTLNIPRDFNTYNGSEFDGALKIKSFTVSSNNTMFAVGAEGALCSKDKSILYKYPSGLNPSGAWPSISSTVTYIYYGAFYQQQYCTSLRIPYGVTRIGTWAFARMPKLQWARIPSSVTTFDSNGYYLFNGDSNLTRLYLTHATPPSFQENTFNGVPNTGTLYVDYDYTTTYSNNTVLKSAFKTITYGAYDYYTNGVAYRVLNTSGYTGVDGKSYAGVVRAVAAVNPSEIQTIGATAVNSEGAVTITSPTFSNKSWCCTTVQNNAFIGNTKITKVTFNADMITIYPYAFYGCSALTAADLSSSRISQISSYAFGGCTKLDTFYWPSGGTVRSIGDYAFANSYGPISFYVPYGVTSVGNYAFSGLTHTNYLNIPSSVTSLGNYFAKNCTNMFWIGVNSIVSRSSSSGSDEFGTTLTSKSNFRIDVPFGSSNKGIGALSGMSSYMHNGGSWDMYTTGTFGAASGTSQLYFTVTDASNGLISYVGLPSWVTQWFSLSDYLQTKVTLPQTLSMFGKSYTVTAIGDGALYNTSRVQNFQFPTTVTKIGASAFYKNTSLKFVGNNALNLSSNSDVCTINKVTSIGNYAFYDCNICGTHDFSSDLASLGSYAFSLNPNIQALVFRRYMSKLTLGTDAWGNGNGSSAKVYVNYQGYSYYKDQVSTWSSSLRATALNMLVPYVASNHPKYRGAAVDANLDLSISKLPAGVKCYYVNYYDSQKKQALTTQINGAVAAGQGFIVKMENASASDVPGGKFYPLPLSSTGYNLPGNMLMGITSSDLTTVPRQTGLDYYSLGSNGKYNIKTGDLSFYASSILTVNSSLTGGLATIPLDLEAPSVKGDVNGDGVVTSTDIACIVNVLAGLEPASKYEGRADVNGDNAVTSTDIAEIVNILAGLG